MKHIVGFSGGIDSQACARWVLNRYRPEDVILTNSDAGGNEHQLTTDFIEWYSANVHPVTRIDAVVADMWETPGYAEKRGYDGSTRLTFDVMAEIKGRFPSRVAQFCTEILKLRPQRRWIREQFGPMGPFAGEDYTRYSGVRRDESEARKNVAFCEWDAWFDCEINRPIADWTKRMCFDFVRSHGERVNELYALGFDRVGCAPCVNSAKDDIANWAVRFPQVIDKLDAWEQRTGRTFFHAIRIPGMPRTVLVRDVVRWAMTGRGGRQDLFPIMHERPACESR